MATITLKDFDTPILIETYNTQGFFFESKIWDARILIPALINNARLRIIFIDDAIDDRVLNYLKAVDTQITPIIYTSSDNLLMRHDIALHNRHFTPVRLKLSQCGYDHYLIIDDTIYILSDSFNELEKGILTLTEIKSTSPDELINSIEFN